MALEIQFAAVNREPRLFALFKKVRRRFITHFRYALEILFPANLFIVVARRASSAVSISERQKELARSVAIHAVMPALCKRFRIDERLIEHMQIARDFRPIHAAPAKSMMREFLSVVIGPENFLRGQTTHAEADDNLRQRRRIAERIGQPDDFALHSQFFLEIVQPIQQLTNNRLAAREVRIRLHPHAALGDPLPTANSRANFLKQFGIVFAAHLIQHALALQKQRLRIFLQKPQLLGERARRFAPRFGRRPQPRHVKVRIGDGRHRRRKSPVFRRHEGGKLFARGPICLSPCGKGLF